MTKLEKAFKIYEKMFGDVFPTFPFMSYDDEEIIKIIEKCIKTKKSVYDLGILSLESRVKY